jgi:Holliday junction resolvasome RuvABC ATP-dependent DNA helicase subunit
VDQSGLTQLDYHYLQALEPGPRGLPALQELLPVTRTDEIALEVEGYLFDLGAIQRTPKGRALTALGETLVHRHRSQIESEALEEEK